jgi:hypothetical protein
MRAWKTLAALLFVLGLGFPAPASAMSILVGQVVFDTFVPGPDGKNSFLISNFTGGFVVPPDFDVASPLAFDSPLLEWAPGSSFAFGNVSIGPGNHDPEPQIQFQDTDVFVSARFTALLSQTIFTLTDGRLFQAISTSIEGNLVNPGGALAPGDFAILSVEANEIAEPPVSVPEPSSLMLIGTALAGSYRLWRKPKMSRQREPLR